MFAPSPEPPALAIVDFARTMIEEAFAPLDPRIAQKSTEVERCAATLGKLMPEFYTLPRVLLDVRHMVRPLFRSLFVLSVANASERFNMFHCTL